MPLILYIDTATEHASVCLARENNVLAIEHNYEQKEHAKFVHAGIKQMMETAREPLKNLDAIAVASGPGSYTGLRVGLSTAKGLCFALNKPLIQIGTLIAMANAAMKTQEDIFRATKSPLLIVPMIDARRMEIFYAAYNKNLEEIIKPANMLLDTDSFKNIIENHNIIACGSGSTKAANIIQHPNFINTEIQSDASHLIPFALKQFQLQSFANVAYAEPYYLKAFYNR